MPMCRVFDAIGMFLAEAFLMWCDPTAHWFTPLL